MRIAGRRPRAALAEAVRWGDRKVPFGIRTALGLMLMIGGVLGFLPILGFWMAPLGLAFVALDVPFLRRRLLAWAQRVEVANQPPKPD